MVIPPVKLSAAERIINALAFVPRKRGEDFMARHKKEADAMRPIIEDVRREGVIEGLERALLRVRDEHLCDHTGTEGDNGYEAGVSDCEDAIRAEIERLKGEASR